MIRTTLRGGVLKRMLSTAVFALASAGAAQAAVITFEGQSGPVLNQTSLQEAGYTVIFVAPGAAAPPETVQVGRFINGSAANACAPNICPTGNTSTYFDLFNSGFVDILPSTGTTFSFSGLDASFVPLPGVVYPAIPAAIQVLGFNEGSEPVTIQFNLTADANGAYSFQRFDAGDFAQMQFSEIAIVGFLCNAEGQCGGLNNSAGEIALDNITLSDLPVTNVPEPATASLLVFGLLGLGARARRRA
ncbi:NF038120 family PEP-CTERM protein [Massilia sp. LXY-6]|uniref:NF038120 family PEP-CTERM protein n=1 Tax=Massilia sp. LXY-6 TaxID=3379823 RepID=UPI003EE21F19